MLARKFAQSVFLASFGSLIGAPTWGQSLSPAAAPVVRPAMNMEAALNIEALSTVASNIQSRGPQASPRGLRLPPELPGANADPLRLPPYNAVDPRQRLSTIDRLFPQLPSLPPAIQPAPGTDGRPLRLGELEMMAISTSPVIQQAQANVIALRGKTIQDGTHPNPTVGYEGDTIGSGGTANYHGAYITQLVKTAGKLQLAQAASSMDIRNAELELRKARIQVITSVQQRYYAVLAAEEAVRATQALAAFADEAYRVQTEQLRGGEAAPYEPMQLRVLAMQARTALVQARNRYFAAWKQLAAVSNAADMPPTQLAGSLDMSLPAIRFDVALGRALERHTDVLAARNLETKGRLLLRFAEVTPIPDLSFYSTIQRDFTTPTPNAMSFNVQAGLPIPILDRNLGGIQQARGELAKATQQAQRVRNEISGLAADAFERYENSRILLEMYRAQILPDQARVYRGVYERHQQQPDRVSFGDVIVAQQTLAASIANYLTTLTAQWLAVTDLSNVLQVEDIGELRDLGTPLEAGEIVAPPQVPPPPPAPPMAPPDDAQAAAGIKTLGNAGSADQARLVGNEAPLGEPITLQPMPKATRSSGLIFGRRAAER